MAETAAHTAASLDPLEPRPLVAPHTWSIRSLVSGTAVMLGVTGLLVGAVLLQAGKGGGLAAVGGGASTDTFIGGRQAATLLTQINAMPYSKHDWHWRIMVAHRFGHAAREQDRPRVGAVSLALQDARRDGQHVLDGASELDARLARRDRAVRTVRARTRQQQRLVAASGAALFGWICVRLSGVYLAMLTLAFAQICYAVAFQWYDVTGGDNGLIGIWPLRSVGSLAFDDQGDLWATTWPDRRQVVQLADRAGLALLGVDVHLGAGDVRRHAERGDPQLDGRDPRPDVPGDCRVDLVGPRQRTARRHPAAVPVVVVARHEGAAAAVEIDR